MLKQLIDEKSNEIFVLQTAGKGTTCPACVWQTVLHAGTAVHIADKWQPALSLSRAHVYLTLCLLPIVIFACSQYWCLLLAIVAQQFKKAALKSVSQNKCILVKPVT